LEKSSWLFGDGVNAVAFLCGGEALDSCIEGHLSLGIPDFNGGIGFDCLADVVDRLAFVSESAPEESLLADSHDLGVVLIGEAALLLDEVAEQPLLDDSLHYLIDLPLLMNDLGLLDLVTIHVDVRAVVVHGDAVDRIGVDLGAALAEGQEVHANNFI
jgi:hypothetical protein